MTGREQRHSGSRAIAVIERRLALLFTIALVSILSAGGIAYQSAHRLVVVSDSTARTFERIAKLSSVLDVLEIEESEARAIDAARRDPLGAEPTPGGAVVGRELAVLTEMYAENPVRRGRLQELQQLIDGRRAYGDSSAAQRVRDRVSAEPSAINGERRRALMDQIRSEVGAIVAFERVMLEENRASVASATRIATRTVAVEGLLAILLITTAFVIIRRENAKRRAASIEVRRLNSALERRVDDVRAELAGSEARLRDALDHLIEGCVIVSPEMQFEFVNRAAAKQVRLEPEQMIGRSLAEIHPGFAATELYAAVQECLTRRVTLQLDTALKVAADTVTWLRVTVEPITRGAFVLSVDITDAVKAADDLRRSEAGHRALLDGLPDSVFLLDQNGAILDFHIPDPTLLLLPADELRGRPFGATLPAAVAEMMSRAMREVQEKGRSQLVHYDLTLGQGIRKFEAIIVPGEFDRLTIVARDITARHSLEEQLRQSQKMEAVGQLTGGIAHDFNNLLTVISSNAELLAGAKTPGAPMQDELHDILDASKRGADMIARLLGFSRRGMVVKLPADPASVIADFVVMLRRLVPSSVELRVEKLEKGSTVLLDTGSLEQMLANLCTNARDAMPDGGEIHISCAPTFLDAGYNAIHPWVTPGPYVCVSVEDTGIGMDEATRARVFEPFFTTKAVGVGTGLGMAMVYGIMKDHRGMVHLYSEVGRGTTVKLYFPIVEEPASVPPPKRISGAARIDGGTELLLIVEDDDAIRKASKRALESKGYRVLEAPDGEQALAVMQRHGAEVSLIISDLVMPNLGGRQLVEALRADGVRTPVIFTSGYSASTVYQSGEFPEGTSFLHKPWTLTDLFLQVREELDAKSER